MMSGSGSDKMHQIMRQVVLLPISFLLMQSRPATSRIIFLPPLPLGREEKVPTKRKRGGKSGPLAVSVRL